MSYRALGAGLLVWALAASALDETHLVGTWHLKVSGPSHATMILRSDHTIATVVFLRQAFDKKKELWSGEGTWQLDGNALIVRYTSSKQGKTFDETHAITELSTSALRLKTAKGEDVEYVRAP